MSTISEQELNELDKDAKWLHSNYDKLLTEFKEQYIAIKNQHPLEHDKDLGKLSEKLKQRRIEPSQLLIEYIRDKSHEVH